MRELLLKQHPWLANLALFISVVSSPFMVGIIFPIWLLHALTPDTLLFWRLYILWMALVVIVPFLYVWWGVKRRFITDIHIKVRQQRLVPLTLAVICDLVMVIISKIMGAPFDVIALGVSVLVLGSIILLVTFRWKISGHLAGLAASITAMGLLINTQLYWLYLLLPVVMWARVYRGRHDFKQTLAGTIVAGSVTYLTLKIMHII